MVSGEERGKAGGLGVGVAAEDGSDSEASMFDCSQLSLSQTEKTFYSAKIILKKLQKTKGVKNLCEC